MELNVINNFLAAIYHYNKMASVIQSSIRSNDITCAVGDSDPDLSSYVNNCHHAYIYTSCNHSLPLTVSMPLTFVLCRKSAPKLSHSSCTRSLCPKQAASRTAVQPSWGKGAIVNCYTANRRGVSGVWHRVFRMLRVIAKPHHLTLAVNCICVGVSLDWTS